jgi:AcrR family transcriptional regulator
MRLPAKTRRKQIMAAAARLFSRQGFDGTTTREIAQSAGVNEAIIFRHFTSKDELYWAVVWEQIGKGGYPGRLHRRLASSRTAKQALSHVAETLLHRSEEDVALTRLLLFSALRNSELAEELLQGYITESLNLVTDYIREGVARGQLRKIDPAVGARAFLAMVACHKLIHDLFEVAGHPKYDSRELGRQLADIWLNGASARRNSSTPRLRSKGSGRDVRGVAGNGFKPSKKLAGSVSERTRDQAVTA